MEDYGFDHFERDETGKCIKWKLVPSGRIVDKAGFDAWQKTRTKKQNVKMIASVCRGRKSKECRVAD
jgi:hypothetical protein